MRISTWSVGLMKTLDCKVLTLLLGHMGIFGSCQQCFWETFFSAVYAKEDRKAMATKKCKLDENPCLTYSSVIYRYINLFKVEVWELQTTNFFLFMECISGFTTLHGLCLQLAETFTSTRSTCEKQAESFLVL